MDFDNLVYDKNDEKMKVKRTKKKNLNDIFLRENVKYVLENKLDEDVIKKLVKFIENYRHLVGALFFDTRFNVQLYNIILESRNIDKRLDIKSTKIIDKNTKEIVEIKFQSLMKLKLNKSDYKKQEKIIKKIKLKVGAKKLRTDFYIKIRDELNNNIFKNIIYFGNIRLKPESILQGYSFQYEEIEKKEKERKENETDSDDDVIILGDNFSTSSFKEKIKLLNLQMDKNNNTLTGIEEKIQVSKDTDRNNVKKEKDGRNEIKKEPIWLQ